MAPTDDLARVEQYIDAHLDRFVSELQELCRIPSIGGHDEGMAQAERWLVDKYSRIGLQARSLAVPDSHPFVLAEQSGPGRSVLFWNHYDIANFTNPVVYPRDPSERGPFSGDISEGKLYARGSTDDKGTLLARVHAVEAWNAVTGASPVGVKFLTVGKRTVAGPNWEAFLEANHAVLAADCCIWEAGAKDEQERQVITLGHKGYLYVELTVHGTERNWPSRYTIFPNPAWKLAWVLNQLKGPDERVRIPGFYDAVEPISELAKREIYDKLADDIAPLLSEAGLESAVLGVTGRAAQIRLYTEPTLAICSLEAGLPGPGLNLVLPRDARAKLEFRLVPHQDPLRILQSLETYLASLGLGDIEVRLVAQSSPYAIEPDSWLPLLALRTAQRVYPGGAVFAPIAIGFGERHLFWRWLGTPILGFAVGYTGYKIETNEEHIRIDDYRQQVKWVAGILQELRADV
jgi:acetylornithine deacetylase/succinyl-diaminopimelate desuccinylase-like protein